MTAPGAVVRAGDAPAERTATGALVRTVLRTGPGGAGPGLVRRLADVPPAAEFTGMAGAAGELWFVIAGSGRLDVDGQPAGLALRADRGLWIPPGASYRARAGDGAGDGAGDLRLDIVSLPVGGNVGGNEGLAEPAARDLAGCEAEITGDRAFRVLFGPGRGCSAATQFVGEIPPGRAPDHSHPYDELVLILGGEGIAHIGGAAHALAAGTCLHLPPGLPHCLENTGTATLRVLGVFHPAGSPASKLPPPPG